MICSIRMRHVCSRTAFTPRSPRSASAIRPSGSTLDLYSHVPPGMQEEAAAKVDAAIRPALEGR